MYHNFVVEGVTVDTDNPYSNSTITINPLYNTLQKYTPYLNSINPYGFISVPHKNTIGIEIGGVVYGYQDARTPFKLDTLRAGGCALYTTTSNITVNEKKINITTDKEQDISNISIDSGWKIDLSKVNIKAGKDSTDFLVLYTKLEQIIQKLSTAIDNTNSAIPSQSPSPAVSGLLSEVSNLLPQIKTGD